MKSTPKKIIPSSALAAMLLAPVLLSLVSLVGCGGGGGGGGHESPANSSTGANAAAARTARAVVTLQWPEPAASRLIPVASNSVRITITNADGFQVSQVIARPATSAAFANLPPGALTVSATAHADSGGNAQPPQASGIQVVTAVADTQFSLSLTLASTIDHLSLTQSAAAIAVGQTASYAVSAQDAAGNLILTGSTTWQWSSGNTAVATLPSPSGASVVVNGIAPGTAAISVTETESGKSASLPLTVSPVSTPTPTPTPSPDPFAGVKEYLNLDLNNLANYANPAYPVHYDGPVLAQDNTPANNLVTNRGATLGRVLFFDRRLSINDTISCASCHQQPNGMTDSRQFSAGFSGSSFTSAHAMRLGNVRFYAGTRMFWDKRATSVENQATQPIQNSVEMGFDTAHGGFDAVIAKMATLPYYPELFRWVYGDSAITEDRVQKALAQYERSMVSVNSRFDTEFARVFNPAAPQAGIGAPFAGFTAQEERGKQLFIQGPGQGGAGCASCHRAPAFALDPNSRSNGLDAGETVVFKSPSLKNVGLTGPYMHDGRFQTLQQVVDHYIGGIQNGPALDNRLKGPNGQPQRLPLTTADRDAIVAFLRTLNDNVLTSDPKFTNPFIK